MNKHSNFILLRGTAMLQSHSQQTNENSLFFKDSYYSLNFFYSSNLSLHNFFLSLLLLIRCILSLSFTGFLKNIWSPPGIKPRTACIMHKQSSPGFDSWWQPNIFNSVLFKKAYERERIRLISKRRLRKKL